MIVVGEKLRTLINKGLVDNKESFEENSICLSLDSVVKTIEPPAGQEVVYGQAIPEEWVKTIRSDSSGFIIPPRECRLACSSEFIQMPLGFFGFVQTQGSLARLFLQVHCNDAQVDPGYKGKITFEICNLGNLAVRLRPGQPVARLFTIRTFGSSRPYSGRYQGSMEPTVQVQLGVRGLASTGQTVRRM